MANPRNGISALLIFSTIMLTLPASAQSGGLTCSSNDGEYHYCRADTGNRVEMVRQISGARCEQGYSWGYDFRGIWVDRGCRAQFSYGSGDHHERHHHNDSGSDTGAAIAGGILGAMILGSIVADNNSSGIDRDRRNYYDDGYRMGRQDADNGRPNFPGWWSERRPMQYARDFDAGYADGYNNYGRRPPR